MRKSTVTLFSLVLLVVLTVAIVPAQAHGNHQDAGWFHKITGNGRCMENWFEHYPNQGQGWQAGRCPVVTATPDPTEEVTPTPDPTEEVTATPDPTEEVTATPDPTEEVTPTPDPTEEVTPTPDPTDEVTPTPEATDEPSNGGNGGGGNASAPVQPPYIQISVWPDASSMTSHVVGFAWQVNGNWVYTDLNGNSAEDLGERIVTGIEYRDRPFGGTGAIVYGQVLSRLVTGYHIDDVENLEAFLSAFTAYAVMDDGSLVQVYGWYGINDEWMPLGADGVAQYRPQ